MLQNSAANNEMKKRDLRLENTQKTTYSVRITQLALINLEYISAEYIEQK